MQKKSFLHGLELLGTSWMFVGMHGVAPESEPEQSLTELIQSGVCLFESSSEVRNDNHLKFKNIGSILPYRGVSVNAGTMGHAVTTLNVSGTELQDSGFAKFLTQELPTNLAEGATLVYDYGFGVAVNRVVLDSPEAITGLRVELEVGGVWQLVTDVVGSNLDATNVDLVATRARLTNISSSTQTVYNCLELYSDDIQVDAPVPETIGWCLMIPKSPLSASASYGQDFPYGWVDCAGPNDPATCILNTANPDSGNDVRLLYMTLQPQTVEF